MFLNEKSSILNIVSGQFGLMIVIKKLQSRATGGILYHDSETRAELLNHKFKSVFTMNDDRSSP